MFKIAFKSIHLTILSLFMTVSIAVSAGTMDDAVVHDAVELRNGDIVTGTVLNDTFTVTTPYTNTTCEKDKISEIKVDFESDNHDVIVLKTGGLLEGTIEEPTISFELISGRIISLEKEQCKKIILKRKAEFPSMPSNN